MIHINYVTKKPFPVDIQRTLAKIVMKWKVEKHPRFYYWIPSTHLISE